jgi:hypothetical protein
MHYVCGYLGHCLHLWIELALAAPAFAQGWR